jgi:hypothetical protein
MTGYEKAKELLGRHMDALKDLTDVLLTKETIDAEEVAAICREAILSEGLEPPKPNPDASFGGQNPPPEEEDDDNDEDDEDDGPESPDEE